jgi:hypothetical protein
VSASERIMIFSLLSRYKLSKFLTRYYCRVIFRESTTCGLNPIVGNQGPLAARGERRGRFNGTCAFPDRRPRLEQVPSVLISKISGKEIANTKT